MHPRLGYLAAAALSQVKAAATEQDLAAGSRRERRRFPLCSLLGPQLVMAASCGVHVLMRRARAARAFRGSGIFGRVDLAEQRSGCAGQLGIAVCLGDQVAERALTQLASVLR